MDWLAERYAPRRMRKIFSLERRILLWRKLWLALARHQKRLGLCVITDEALSQMEAALDRIDTKRIEELEKRLRHDVMANIEAFGEVAPAAHPILHLGATSYFLVDNADLINMREALRLLAAYTTHLCRLLLNWAQRHKNRFCLSYTHLQPAQPTTHGRRACLWLQDFLSDIKRLSDLAENLPFRGVKGTVGTQASYMILFDGDAKKVEELDRSVAADFGFSKVMALTSQIYSRKLDLEVAQAVCQLAVSAHKFAQDIRLLTGLGDLRQKSSRTQVGSSAMPHKRNPVDAERVCALCRYVFALEGYVRETASHNWLERSLDDSAARRLYIERLFLAAGSVVRYCCRIVDEFEPSERDISEFAPLLATEGLLMEASRRGGDRQKLHEALRKAAAVYQKSKNANAFLEQVEKEGIMKKEEARRFFDVELLSGRAVEQCERFLREAEEVVNTREAIAPETAGV